MSPKQIPGTMMDAYLRAIRLPVDGAVRLVLSREHSRRSVLHAIDRVDASVRALSGVILRDAPLVESAQQKLPVTKPADRLADPAPRARERARQHEEHAPRKPRRSQDAPAANPVSVATPAHARSDAPSFEDIALQAYELYRAGTPGTTEDHWRMAEADLISRTSEAN